MDISQKPQSLQTCMSSYSPVQLTNTEDLRTWLQQDSLASLSPSRDKVMQKMTTEIYGLKHLQLYAQYDHTTSSWRMCETSSTKNTLGKSLKKFPVAGIVLGTKFYLLENLARRISEIEPGLSPTQTTQVWASPRVHETVDYNKINRPKSGADNLATEVAKEKWPTPQARDYRTGEHKRFEDKARSNNLNDAVDGRLNPEWVEWLMGWPQGWTSLEPLPVECYDEWLHEGNWWANEKGQRTTGYQRHRVARIHLLGNGQVPTQAFFAWTILNNLPYLDWLLDVESALLDK